MVDVNESLPELIRRRMSELGVKNVSELHRRLPDGDDRVSYETLRLAAAGDQSGGDKMLRAVAIACAVPENDVRRAAGVAPTYGEWELPVAAQSLDPTERRVVEGVIDALLRARHEGGQRDGRRPEAEKSAEARGSRVIKFPHRGEYDDIAAHSDEDGPTQL